MPAGDTVSITGADAADFGAVTFTEPGNFTYTVKEIAGHAANYTYDSTVYDVTAYVTPDEAGNLTAKVWMSKEGADVKSENAVFTNEFTLPGTAPTPTSPPSASPTLTPSPAVPAQPTTLPFYPFGLPKTADKAPIGLLVLLAVASAGVLLGLRIAGKRKK